MKKIVLVTGAGKGFGRELVKALSDEFIVVAISRTEADLVSLQTEIPIEHGVKYVCADVAEFESTRNMLSELLNELDCVVFGLINNAGVRCRKKFLELSMAEMISVSQVNLFAAVNVAQFILPYMLKAGAGRIVNISSILSQSALPELSAYAVSKGGLDAFTRSLAVEFGERNIATSSILPGFCKTSYYSNFAKNTELLSMTLQNTPMKRWGEDSELVGLCRFLLSDGAGYINGASIPIDGGWLAS